MQRPDEQRANWGAGPGGLPGDRPGEAAAAASAAGTRRRRGSGVRSGTASLLRVMAGGRKGWRCEVARGSANDGKSSLIDGRSLNGGVGRSPAQDGRPKGAVPTLLLNGSMVKSDAKDER